MWKCCQFQCCQFQCPREVLWRRRIGIGYWYWQHFHIGNIRKDQAISRASEKSPFSPKERETLKYLALGKTREEISIIMGCGVETTKTRVTEIRRKLDASNTTAAIARAYELGYMT